MKIFLLYFILTATFFSCVNKDKSATLNEAALKDSTNFTTIQWLDSTNKNFGTIAEGQKLEVAFHFRNSGNKPLVGKEGNIKAVFDSENHTGVNHKTLNVYANTKGTQVSELQFAVVVEKKKW
jgi:hypothetical protein